MENIIVLVVAWMIVCTNAGCTHRLGVDIGGTKMMIALYEADELIPIVEQIIPTGINFTQTDAEVALVRCS